MIRENTIHSSTMTASISTIDYIGRGRIGQPAIGEFVWSDLRMRSTGASYNDIAFRGGGGVVMVGGVVMAGGDKPEGKRGLSVPIKGLDCEAGESFYGPVP